MPCGLLSEALFQTISGNIQIRTSGIGDAVRCDVGPLGSRIPNHTTLTFPNVGQVDLEGAVASATLDHTPGNAIVYSL
jgi:hypothetical protein